MQLVPVIVPQLGNAMEEVTVAEWYVDVGERVQEGEPIVMVDSEKAQSELEAPATGTIHEIVVPDGGTAEAGDRLAVLAVG
jgi:2-oxoglutarate dehydrogenase E2 component (dihydrolipoamide succinyltransferase)